MERMVVGTGSPRPAHCDPCFVGISERRPGHECCCTYGQMVGVVGMLEEEPNKGEEVKKPQKAPEAESRTERRRRTKRASDQGRRPHAERPLSATSAMSSRAI